MERPHSQSTHNFRVNYGHFRDLDSSPKLYIGYHDLGTAIHGNFTQRRAYQDSKKGQKEKKIEGVGSLGLNRLSDVKQIDLKLNTD